MRLDYERSGGFAGLRFTATVDTASLPAAEAAALREMVERAKFFDLPAVIPTLTPGADRFVYKLTVEVEGRRQAVEAGESAIPDALRPLIEQLQRMARRA